MLIPPKEDVPLHIYLLAMKFTLGFMLAQKNDQANEQAIYYLNHTHIDYELRYVYIENTSIRERISYPIMFSTKVSMLGNVK